MHSSALFLTGDPVRIDERFSAFIGFFTKRKREGDCKIEGDRSSSSV